MTNILSGQEIMMTSNKFYPKALVVSVERENINVVSTSLLNMGATILGVEDKPHSVSKKNIVALIKTKDDIKVDIIRRKLEYVYG